MVESQRAQQKPFDGSSSSVTHTFTVTYILLAKASLMVELEADDGGKSISSARKGTTSHMPWMEANNAITGSAENNREQS